MNEQQQANAPVRISREVFRGIEFVRTSGATNMFDRKQVIELAEIYGYDETAQWCRAHKHLYGQLIIYGPEVDESE